MMKESRKPKAEARKKSEVGGERSAYRSGFFGFRHSGFFRMSSFGFRISGPLLLFERFSRFKASAPLKSTQLSFGPPSPPRKPCRRLANRVRSRGRRRFPR